MVDYSGISDKFVRAMVYVLVGYNRVKIKDHLLWASSCRFIKIAKKSTAKPNKCNASKTQDKVNRNVFFTSGIFTNTIRPEST